MVHEKNIFDINKFFGSGHFLVIFLDLMNMYLIFKLFFLSFKLLVQSHFFIFLPKIGTVTPEDMLFPKMSVCGWISNLSKGMDFTYQ